MGYRARDESGPVGQSAVCELFWRCVLPGLKPVLEFVRRTDGVRVGPFVNGSRPPPCFLQVLRDKSHSRRLARSHDALDDHQPVGIGRLGDAGVRRTCHIQITVAVH